jgi:hypothetical protein
MTNKPEPVTPPRPPPLVLPPNGRDVTAEKVGTIFAIVGAGGAQKLKGGVGISGATAPAKATKPG